MTANPRALIATIVVLVVTPIFGLFVAPLLTLAPSGTAYAQEGPSIEIEFDPEGTVVATTSIDFTLTFSDLTGYDTNSGLKYRVNVVGSGNPSVTDCESGNAFSDTVGIGTISSGTATAAGTIPDTCLPGHHILVASLYDNNGDEIISTAKGFVVSPVKSLVLPPGNGNKPAKPAGLWGERVQHTVSPSGIAGTRFHVVDSASSTVYVYDLPAYDDPSTSTRDVVDTEVLLFVNTYAPASTTNPWGIVVEGPATWVSDDLSGSVDKVFAYTRSGERISNEEFGLYSANSAPRGMHYTGNLLVADDAGDKIFAYERWQGSISYAPGRDYPLHDENTNITGIWASGHIMWVADSADEKLYAYEMYPTKDHLPEKDVNGITDNPAGIWSDNNLIYVLDSELKSIHGYKMPRRNNSPHVVSGPTYKGYPENSTDFIGPYRAQDPENRSVSWSLYPSGDHQHFNISGGYLYFNSPPNYEDAKDINGDNIYQLILIATSGRFAHTYFPVKVEVTDVLGEQPMFTDTSTTRTVEENTLAGENIGDPVEAVNPDDDPIHIYSMSGTDAASFDFSTSTGQIITRDALNFESKPSYSVRVSVRDGENEDQSLSTSTDDFIDVTIDITDLDEGPEVDGPIYVDHPEGVLKVAQYTADDPNSRTITWELSGDDDSKFRISATGTLTFGDLPDHETPGDLDTDNTYEITITATGGTETGSLDVTVYVANVNETPYFDPSQATRSVVENTGYNQNVGAPVEASDDDDGDSLTYLLGGDDASSFSIDTSTGQILTDADLDHETDDSYTVTVIARDQAGATSSISVLISVTNANDQPEFPATETGQRSVEENKSNANVGAPVAASDQDDDGLTYELTGGATSTFTINSSTGQLTTVGALDSDAQDTYSVTVSVRDNKDDQGASDTAEDDSITVSITVTDVNETPVVTGVASPEFAENSNGTVAEYDDNDPEGNSITWSLAGVDADEMDISGGVLTFNSPPDHETRDTYNVIVQAFDGNSTGTLAVVVTVTDVNEAPEFSDTTTTRTVEENSGANAIVGLPVAAEDPDSSDTLTYILSGTGAASFTIDSNGQIKTVSSLDGDTQDTHYVTVEVHDGNADDGSVSTTTDDYIDVTITVTDVNEPPVLTGSASVELAENSTTTVGTYTATDPERVTPTWDLSGVDEDDFEIIDGVLTFKSLPDHEGATDANTDSVYHVTIVASDGNNNAELPVTITVTNVNERPEFPSTETGQRSVVENTGANQTVGVPVAAIDPDRGDTLTYELGGQDASSFNFVTTTGQIQTKEALDSDSQATYSVTVEVHDGKDADGNTSTSTDASINVTITVTDVNEPPVVSGTTTTEYAENDIRSVETYSADDPETDGITWSLSGVDEDDFEITQGGVLGFAATPDFESPTDSGTNSVYNVDVLAADGTSTTTYPVTVTVTNVNERPEFPSTETGQRSVVENTGANQTVGVPVAAIDPDRGDTLTYELGGQDASSFNFDTSSGQIRTKEALDSDSQASYAVTVSVRDSKDADGNADTATDDTISVTITVTDINEPPVVTGTTTTEYAENDTRAVETYTATDPENDHITWSLSGTDSDAMDITPSGGELTFNDPPNYEDKSVFLVTVQASDGHSTTTHAVRINITDINERPEFSGATTSRSVVENTPAGRNIGLPVVAADQDRGDALTYILGNSAVEFFDIDETTGQLKTKSELNAESRATYNVYVDVHDGKDDEGSPDTTVDAYIYVTITIENVDEPPVVTGTTSTEFVENSALTVAVYDARDPEGETVIWSLSGDDADSFEITRGALSFLKSPDYEAKSQYSITVDASDGGLTSSLNVNVTITNEDEAGAIALSSQQPQADTPLTATLEDPDGNLAGDTWVWESSTSSSWSAISGATSRSYTPVDGDVDSFLRVTASYTDGHGSGKSAQAEATHSVRAAPIQNTAPEFQGTTTSREVAENSGPGVNIGAPVTATDAQQNDTLNYTLSGTDESFFSIDSQTGQLKTSASLNHEGKETYTVIVTASDPSNAKDTITVTITVTDVDEVPELTGRTMVEHVETATGPVHTFTAKDPEEGTITWGLLGDDEEDFTIAGGNLNFASTPDLENPADADRNNVYRVTVEASDGTNTSTLAVTVIVIGVNEPAVFPGATTSRDVTENTPADQNVGAPVSASDPEKDDLTYTLDGIHRQHFDIATTTGQILTKGALNYEGTKSYSVTVSVTDGRNADGDTDTGTDASIQVTINVLDENEAPEITGLSSRNWDENATGAVATYSADDPENATTTWTVDGTDKAHFAITEEGVLSIDTVPDYETPADSDRNNVYQIAVQAADDGNIISRYDVTINIVNVDEDGVVQVSPSQPEVGTLVNAELSDPDGVTSVPTWVWWRSSTANGPWSNISNATASSYMPTTADEDNYLRATVSYTDQQGSGKSASGVTANAVQAGPQTNNAPAFLPNTIRNVDENTAPEQPIGDPVAAQDAQSDDNLVYELGGPDADSFGFSTSTGQLYTKAALDYETKPSYTVTITVSDGKNVDNDVDTSTDDTITVTINVTDVNEPPVVTGTTTTEYVENGTVSVATYTVVDPENDNISWSPLGGDGGAFTMSASGVLSFRTPPDFEAKEGYQLTVNAFDGELTGTLDVTITITNVNEPPDVTGRTTITHVETAPGPIETFKAKDPEKGDITWELSGFDEGDFTIEDGVLDFATTTTYGDPLDADGNNVYVITVKATDDVGKYDELDVTVIVTDENQVPEFPGATTIRDVSENLASGQNVGSPVRATDPEHDYLTYSLGGTNAALFDIATSTGQILTKSDLDYEGSPNTYSVTVSVTDSKNADGNADSITDATIQVTINVIDENEAPEISGATTTSWNENATGTVASYSAEDPESATTTWTVHGTDAAHFGITRDDGELYIETVPNYEGKRFYQVRVQVTDGSNIADLGVTITITNVDEPGVVTLSPTSPEVGTPVNASLTDPDHLVSTTSWSWHRSPDKNSWGSPIAGATGSAYTPVNADEGNYLQATASYDDGHAAGKSASGVSDSKVPSTNSQPTFSPNIIRSVDENTEANQPIGKPVTATDDETDDLTYSLGGDDAAHFDIATSTGQLKTVGPLDFEDKASYSVTVSVSDGNDVGSNVDTTADATVNVIITVNNVDEAPVVTGNEAVNFAENSTSSVATFTGADPEKRSVTWTLAGIDEDDFTISTEGVLNFNSPPDFEGGTDADTNNVYLVTVRANDARKTGTLEVVITVTNVDEEGSISLSSVQPQVDTQLTATLSDPDGGVTDVSWTWERSTSGQDPWTTVATSSNAYTPDVDDEDDILRVTANYSDSHGSNKEAHEVSQHPVKAAPILNTAPGFQPGATREVAENTESDANIGEPVTATDSEDTNLTYTLGGTDAASFAIERESGQLKTKDPLDHETKDTYTITITASDPSNASSTITVTITVTDVNEPPTVTGPNTVTYPENNSNAVATYTVTDPENGRVTLELKGEDGGQFRIDGGNLNFNAQPDYETPLDEGGDNEYHVTVEAFDGTSTSTLAVTVTVTNVNEGPQFPNGDTGARSVTENTAKGQNVGAPVSASDPEKDALYYTLSGIDARYFGINSSSGQILAKAALNHESKSSYSVKVSVRDSKNVDGNIDAVTDDTIDITITVIDENEAPVITGATSTNFAENGTRAVASYRGRDPEGGSVSWTLLGTDSAYFAITNGGVLSFDPAPDFEDPMDSDRNNVYHVTVQASDGNNISRLEMTVTVTNVEEAGTVELSSVQPQVDTAITTTLSDPDEVISDITWSWQRSRAGSRSSWTTITGATSDSYTPVTGDGGRYLRVTARYDDGYGTGKSASAISENTVRAVQVNNDPPRFLSQFERRNVDENTAPGQNVGDPVTAVDDPNDNLTYGLGGTDAALFSIVRSTGQIQTRMPLDYEARTGYSVSVTAADPSNATSSIRVNITVVNIDEPPVAVDDTARATEDGSAVTINVLDNDSDPEGENLTLAATTQPANGNAVVEGRVVKFTPNPGYYGSDSFTYTVSDGTLTSVGNVSVTVDADGDLTVQVATIPIQFVPIDGGGERILLSDYFSDPDDGHPPYQATISDSAIATVEVSEGYLTITPVGIGVATTTLTVSDTPGINQEFRVVVYRPVVERTDTETVHIVDPAVETTLTSTTTATTTSSLSVIFQAGARDQFFQAAIDAQSNNCGVEAPIGHQHVCVLVDLFDLGAQSIEESLDLPSTLHVDLDQTLYSAVQTAITNGEFQMWKGHGPTDVSWDQIQQCPDPVGTDECYSLTEDPNGGGKITVFNIEGFSEFAAGSDQPAPPPTEPPTTTPPPSTGGGGSSGGGSGGSGSSGGGGSSGSGSRSRSSSSYEYQGNQTPQIFGQTNVTFSENGTDPVAEFIAEDPDDDDITWSLLGYDRRKFEISNDGVLSFRSPPDYENPEGREGNTYQVILQAEDDGRPSEYDVHNVRVTVTQVNELGAITGASELSLPENQTDLISQYQVDDPEKGVITWSLSGPDALGFEIDDQGNLSPAGALDFESPSSSAKTNVHSLTITATDNGKPDLSAEFEVSVTISNVNEAPHVGEIPGVELSTRHLPWMLNLAEFFTDPDGDSLSYEISGRASTEVAHAAVDSGTLSITPAGEGTTSFYVVAGDSGGLRVVGKVAVSVTEPAPAPTPVPAKVTVPVPTSTPAPVAVVETVPPPSASEPVVAPEPPPTYVPLWLLSERRWRNLAQQPDKVSKLIATFKIEPHTEPVAELMLPPMATTPVPPKYVVPMDDIAAGNGPGPMSVALDDGGGLSIWLILMLVLIAFATAGYTVRMYVIHRL